MVLLNSTHPRDEETVALAESLSEQYGVPVLPVSCTELNDEDIEAILSLIAGEFPITEISVDLPKWLNQVDGQHPIRRSIYDALLTVSSPLKKVRETKLLEAGLSACPHIRSAKVTETELGNGTVHLAMTVPDELFYRVLGEMTGIEMNDEGQLMKTVLDLAKTKKAYDKIQSALNDAEQTGYGIVLPAVDEMVLEEPEIIKQGGRYGVRLKAQAPSIHMMKATIETEVSPIVGSEKQSEELVSYLLREFAETPSKIWESNIFGTSLYGLVNEGLHNKLFRMPTDARLKLRDTVERIINDGCNGLICIIV